MSDPSLPGLFGGPSPLMAPSAVQARRSGRQRVISQIGKLMAAYRDCLIAHGPMTDHEAAARLRWPLSVVNARRGDWQMFRPGAVVAVDRVRKDWGSGKATTRCVWGWAGVQS